MRLRACVRLMVVTAAVVAAFGGSRPASGQAGGAQAGAVAGRPACGPEHSAPSAADKALLGHKYAEAERLYAEALAANPGSSAEMAGLVRTALAEDKIAEALAMATKDDAEHPNDPVVLDALGEVRFRRGEVDEAAIAYNKSSKLGPCAGLTHYDVARFLNLNGMYASAQRQLDFAHTLAPDNPEITRRWRYTHGVPLTAEQRLAQLRTRLDDPKLTDEQKDGINAAMRGIETREKGSCELVTPIAETKLPMLPIANGPSLTPQQMYAAGLEVQFNGKKRRLEIDSGASGMLLSRSVAKAAGLVSEMEVKSFGVGDSGMTGTFVTHVDDIKIGKLEFKNCMVQVVEKAGVLDVYGLIGPDVFRDYLVTLDIPGREVRLSPLPKRPDEAEAKPAGLATSEDDLSMRLRDTV